jgi:GAF domain-containing protein
VTATAADPQQIITELKRQLDRRTVERDEYRAERNEALEQQTATAKVLQVINSSSGDLAPVFDSILEKAHSLCGATFGSLQIYDGEFFRSVAARGLPAAFVEMVRQPFRPDPNSFEEWVVRGEDFVHVPDVTALGPLPDNAISRAAVEMVGLRTVLLLPLRKETALVGYIAAARSVVQPFADREIALLQNFAAQAVIAMENARLITETREALEQQTATAEVLQVINSSPGDLAPVFDAILEKAHALCGIALGVLELYEDGKFHAVAVRGVSGPLAELLRQPFVPPPKSPLARLLAGERSVQISDLSELAQDQPDDPRAQAGVQYGLRTVLFVPLRKDDALLGYITAYRREVRPFSDKEIVLLENFAAQAVIATENARLITETREALEQQTATAEVLQVINSSPGDIGPVFDAMLEKALRLCGANFGILRTYDGNRVHMRAARGVPSVYADFLNQHPPQIEHGTIASRILDGEPMVHTIDLMTEEIYRTGAPVRRALVDMGGARTSLVLPLTKEGSVLGDIQIYRQHVQAFSNKQISLLQHFAAQAVIAKENARLITETREALDQQTATTEVLQVINSSPGDLAPVFDAMLEKATSLCLASFGILWVFDGEFARAGALHQVPTAYAELCRNPFRPSPESGPARMMRGEDSFAIADLTAYQPYQAGDALTRAIVDLGGARSVAIAPLRRDDVTLGAITIYQQALRPFSDTQIALLQNFAAQAVIAMENARLLGELRARTDEVAGWNRELEARVAAQLAEIERTGKLRRFLAPQLADLIVAQGDDSILESHRREIVVVFCDLRGFTGFAERAEPEEVMALLGDYHAAMGPIVASFEGTLDHYAGDGIMVFFNDPLPTPEPARRAIEMAVAMRKAAVGLLKTWHRHGHVLGFGVGISQGYATLGQIGFAERMDYTAIGTVTNLAARLCGEANDGQILISRRVAVAVEDMTSLEEIGDLSLKGLSQAVAVYNVVQ